MKKIGFVGVGIMGKSMVRNLMKAGFEVSIYTRTKSKVEDVIGEGAIWCDSVAECAKGRDAVISIVGYPKDVIEVYFGPAGILANADPGTYVIDMTTTSPKLAVQIFDEAEKLGLHAIEILDGITESCREEKTYHMTTKPDQPAMLPQGFIYGTAAEACMDTK